MKNKVFELDRLKSTLRSRGISEANVLKIIARAEREIDEAVSSKLNTAMEEAISAGVDQRSPDFINALQMNSVTPSLEAYSTDFSEPPFPMLPKLLKNAKPMKDGSGVYKVIPVGSRNGPKPGIANNIFDAQKRVSAERLENAKAQYANVSPSSSKTQFRTATSKQDTQTQWVMPAKEKNFGDILDSINSRLTTDTDSIIEEIIREYEESFA